MLRPALFIALAVACAHADPQQRAKSALDAQLAALPGHDDKLAALFAPEAVLVLPGGTASASDFESIGNNAGDQIAGTHPGASVAAKKIENLVAEGNANVVWFAADLTVSVKGGTTVKRHVVELLDGARSWKPVVAAFSPVAPLRPYSSPRGEIVNPTAAASLAKVIADPAGLAAMLDDNALVLGTDANERAIGKPAAQKLLATWAKLGLAVEPKDKLREVSTKTYGYAIANVTMPNKDASAPPYRMHALVISSEGRVVAVSFGAQ